MGSIIGHRRDYNDNDYIEASSTSQKILTQVPPNPLPPPYTPVKAMYIIGHSVCTIPAVVLEHESHFQHLLLINS